MTGEYPELPEEAIPDGWEVRLRSEDTLFRIPGASVVGRTLLYSDTDVDSDGEANDSIPVTDAVEETDDRLIPAGEVRRFFFATALSFRPPLAPWIGPSSVYPMVLSEARRAFDEDLRARGLTDVDRERTERIRTDAGDRVRLTKVTATLPCENGPAAPVEGWLGVWTHQGSFRIAGGAHPTSALDDTPNGDSLRAVDPATGREQLLRMIRAVV